MLKFLCRLNFHAWQFLGLEWGSFGMGLEKFETFRCRRCGVYTDRLYEPHGKRIDASGMKYRYR